MKGLKDFFYDKNDIIIALAILMIAALLIVWRMEVIMDYPETLALETGTIDTTEPSAVDDSAGLPGTRRKTSRRQPLRSPQAVPRQTLPEWLHSKYYFFKSSMIFVNRAFCCPFIIGIKLCTAAICFS